MVIFPDNVSCSILFEKILSIRVQDLGVIRVGELMCGKRKASVIMSRKSLESLTVSYLRISILKSPNSIIFFFSLLIFLSNSFRWDSRNSGVSIHGCLYMHPIIVFLPVGLIVSIKTDSSSFSL